jgi:uncharacterized OB-fold protein
MTQHTDNWAEGLPLMAGQYFIGLYQPSPETVGYWEGVRTGELRLKWCPHCARHFHPKRIVCTVCGASDLQWRAVSGRGHVYSFSEVHRAPAPEFAASVPYSVGLVALEEGVHMFTRFIPAAGPVAVGAPVHVDFQVLEQGVLMPVFRVGAA